VLEGHLYRISDNLFDGDKIGAIPVNSGSGSNALIGGPNNPAHGMTMSMVWLGLVCTAFLKA
jgi:hypothetical protein